MYEYLQALHQCFFREPEHTEITKLQWKLEVDGLYSYDAEMEEQIEDRSR